MSMIQELNISIDKEKKQGVFYDKTTNEYASGDNLTTINVTNPKSDSIDVVCRLLNLNVYEHSIYRIVANNPKITLDSIIRKLTLAYFYSNRSVIRQINNLLDKGIIINNNNHFEISEKYSIENTTNKYIIIKL